jgi:hypothetical protein
MEDLSADIRRWLLPLLDAPSTPTREPADG